MHVKANWQLLVDNILDLTHVAYIHARTIGGNPNVSLGIKIGEFTDEAGKIQPNMLDVGMIINAAIGFLITTESLELTEARLSAKIIPHLQVLPKLTKLKIETVDISAAEVEAVRAAAPKTRLIVDANEALSFEDLVRLAPDFARLDVALIEQPLPAGQDGALEGYACPVLLCADESIHTRDELDACARRYGCVNIKLDKAGGLTEALAIEFKAFGVKVADVLADEDVAPGTDGHGVLQV